jgi:hypothetical protein
MGVLGTQVLLALKVQKVLLALQVKLALMVAMEGTV